MRHLPIKFGPTWSRSLASYYMSSRAAHGGRGKIHLDTFVIIVLSSPHLRRDSAVVMDSRPLVLAKVVTAPSLKAKSSSLRVEKMRRKGKNLVKEMGEPAPTIIISNENSKEFRSKLRVQEIQGFDASYSEAKKLFLKMESSTQNHPRILAPTTFNRPGSCNVGEAMRPVLSLPFPRVPIESRSSKAPSLTCEDTDLGCISFSRLELPMA
ncbi:hypothetical protein HAX54_026041 [Datura stramonium]|uniref:Uncharacterized protein n=1 Tax=Datura stramonium TaxID=4076 RepID=A0ABS8V1A3_DATST|nr:hypothetical protein [Datura stramonium]